MSLFKKPRRNVRQRQLDSEDEESMSPNLKQSADEEEEDSIASVKASIAKLKETKKAKSKNRNNVSSSANDSEKKNSLLSFNDFDAEADDGEVFRVKKSSQSRRLMKQIKAERKQREKDADILAKEPPLPKAPPPPPPPPIITPEDEEDLGIRLKSTLTVNKLPEEPSRMLSGYEAEALHLEDEDLSEEDDENVKDPLQEILQRGDIPDAAAIFAARKRRQEAREKGSDKDFIPVRKPKDTGRLAVHDDDSDDDENKRMEMKGTRTDFEVKQKEMDSVDEDVIDHSRWEEQQIRKAVGSRVDAPPSPTLTDHQEASEVNSTNGLHNHAFKRDAPKSYNLEGIKERLKKRISSLTEVHRRHVQDQDKTIDDLIESQSTIEEKEKLLPQNVRRHQFYQDLRGYFTDYVECYNEKLKNIKFVESKYHGIKASIYQKKIDRRREDVRDQMRELSNSANMPSQMTAEEATEEWARQQRAAEREGRRRRREQHRRSKAGQLPPHNDGMSSDDELSRHDEVTFAESRKDVENQARTIMVDVVEDFSTFDAVLERVEEWKRTDAVAYSDSYVSLCVHKLLAPLVTLKLLFFNPLEEHASIEEMEWYRRIAMFSHQRSSETSDAVVKADDQDNFLLSLVIEKVVLVKIHSLVSAAYDPLSTSQTMRLTQLLKKMRTTYPTLTGSSKNVGQILTSVIERLRSSIDNDVYIPLGYSQQ